MMNIYPIPSFFQELSIIRENEPSDKTVEKEKNNEMSLHLN